MSQLHIQIPHWHPPSLNVYLRMHWARRKRLLDETGLRLLAAMQRQRRAFTVPVTISYTLWSVRLRDWDNAAGSFKVVGDSLVKLGVLKDDNPEQVVTFDCRQFRVPVKEHEGTQILITEVKELSLHEYLSPFATMGR